MYNLGFLYLPATCPPLPSSDRRVISPCLLQALDFHSRTKAMKFLPYVDFPRSVLALRIPIRGGLGILLKLPEIPETLLSLPPREFFESNFLDRSGIVIYFSNFRKNWERKKEKKISSEIIDRIFINWIIKLSSPQDRRAAFRFRFAYY